MNRVKLVCHTNQCRSKIDIDYNSIVMNETTTKTNTPHTVGIHSIVTAPTTRHLTHTWTIIVHIMSAY